jgi:hypothetical protein
MTVMFKNQKVIYFKEQIANQIEKLKACDDLDELLILNMMISKNRPWLEHKFLHLDKEFYDNFNYFDIYFGIFYFFTLFLFLFKTIQ